MSVAASQHHPDPNRLERAADEAIAACGGDAREAVKALIVANGFLERRLEELASPGYARGRVLPRDRKDWYD
jgi:stage V sporulation protein SpoVS